MLLDTNQCQLVLIDYQERLMPAMWEADAVVGNAGRLSKAGRLLKVPQIFTEQNPAKLGATVQLLRDALSDARARALSKMHFSAMPEGLGDILHPHLVAPQGNARSLPKHLQKPQAAATERSSIVLAGCETHVCLLQTAPDLVDDEFDVWVVTDACSSRSERNRDAAFDRLAGAGVELVTTEMVVFEWLRSAEHALFKEVHALVK